MKIKYRNLAFVFLIAVCGCMNNTVSKKTDKTKNETICKPYFDFDKVEYYFLDIDEVKIGEIEEKTRKTEKERKQLELLIKNTPDKLSDTIYLKDLEEIDFVMHEIASNNFDILNKIFCERKHKELVAMKCEAVYRDILVFKKDNEIIGTAKICFGCYQNVITGTKLNTTEFGQSGDYGKLYEILH